MDSLTQFALGAVVSTACLGSKVGPRKAVLIGGVLGTLPDLDVFIPFDDPIDSFVYHRGWTHSIFVHALAAPVIGEILLRLFNGLRESRWLVWATVFLCLSTHAVIDAMTVYGTRIFWPLYPDPVGVGSVFIIDPTYSLPLLAIVIWALFKKSWTTRFRNGVAAALIFSTGYLGLSMVVQKVVEGKAEQLFAEVGTPPDTIYAIAAPFNILLWKVIGLKDDQYQNLYVSLFDGDGDPEIYAHPRHPELVACIEDTPAFNKLEWFSRGFYKADLVDGKVVVSDLRMGLTPGYAFRFAIAEQKDDKLQPIEPERVVDQVRVEEDDWAWLGARLKGEPRQRNAEARLVKPIEVAAQNFCGQEPTTAG